MKKILLLGGAGYLGTALYHELRKKHKVTVVDMGIYDITIPDVTRMDYSTLQSSYIKLFDVVILLAGYSSAAAAMNSPHQLVVKNNFMNFVGLLDKLAPTQKFIYMSSSGVYDGLTNVQAEEYDESSPSNLYNFTKVSRDNYISILKPQFEWYGLRLGTVNGFSEHFRKDTMFNKMVDTATKENKIYVTGGHNKRAILSMKDYIGAVNAIIDSTKDYRGIYNLVSFNASVMECAETVANELLCTIDVVDHKKYASLMGTELPKGMNFSVSSEKFGNTFNFEFDENPVHIIDDIMTNLDKIKVFSVRNAGYIY